MFFSSISAGESSDKEQQFFNFNERWSRRQIQIFQVFHPWLRTDFSFVKYFSLHKPQHLNNDMIFLDEHEEKNVIGYDGKERKKKGFRFSFILSYPPHNANIFP